MGKTFGNTHILPRFKNISDNMDLIFFVQVYTNIVLLDEVQSKETIRKIFNNPCIIPQFIYISDKRYEDFVYAYSFLSGSFV